jgi:hypothetical protein
VPSGRRAIGRLERSVKVYISFMTTSDVSPKVRWNTARGSIIGVLI